MQKGKVVAIGVALGATALTFGTGKGLVSSLRAADQHWNKVFEEQKLDASVNVCAPDGAVLAPNAPAARGRNEIRKLFAGFFTLPKLHITWTPTTVEVARAGDMGFTSGSYHMTFNDPSGKQVVDDGKYSTVWERRHGHWLVACDCFNSDMPMPSK